MATEAPAVIRATMTRVDMIAALRARLGLDLAWDAASDADLATMLAEIDGPDDRFADWEPRIIERRAEVR